MVESSFQTIDGADTMSSGKEFDRFTICNQEHSLEELNLDEDFMMPLSFDGSLTIALFLYIRR